MRRGGAAALCPATLFLSYDAHTESLALTEVALALLQYTPELAHSDNKTLLMDVTASLTLFGCPRAIYRQVCTTLGRLGFTARIAMAPTAEIGRASCRERVCQYV